MLDEGLITREEYEEQKEALLLELLLKRRGAVIECPRCGARVKAASGKNALQRGVAGLQFFFRKSRRQGCGKNICLHLQGDMIYWSKRYSFQERAFLFLFGMKVSTKAQSVNKEWMI